MSLPNNRFKERAKLFPLIQEQLNRHRMIGIKANQHTFWLDFRKISIPLDQLQIHKSRIPIVLLTGWGSGWEGIVPLAVSLAFEGFKVYLFSLPGYGSSGNAPREFYTHNFLDNAAEVLFGAMQNLDIKKAHLVGHSMGAEVMARIAAKHPKIVETLVALNPSGLKPYKEILAKINLIYRLSLSGIKLRQEYQELLDSSGEQDYLAPMIDWCSKQKSPWGDGRRMQRLYEFLEITRGTLPEVLSKITCPIFYFSGNKDTVFPPNEQERIFRKNTTRSMHFKSMTMPGVHHNPTLFFPEETAATIASFLKNS